MNSMYMFAFTKNMAMLCMLKNMRARDCLPGKVDLPARLALYSKLAHSLQGPHAWKTALHLLGNATMASLEPNAISLSSLAANLFCHIIGRLKQLTQICLQT